MSIWYQLLLLRDLQKMGLGTMMENIGIRITEVGEDYLKGTMPVNHRTTQPMGLLHGGASVALAETLGSIASYLTLDSKKYYSVGLDINANHIRQVGSGTIVTGIAKPIHLGKSTQVWGIEIFNEEGKMVCISRLTMAVLSRAARIK